MLDKEILEFREKKTSEYRRDIARTDKFYLELCRYFEGNESQEPWRVETPFGEVRFFPEKRVE